MGAIREILEAKLHLTPSEPKKAEHAAADQIVRLLEDKKIKPEQVSIREVFDQFCDRDRTLDLQGEGASVRISEAMAASDFPYITGKLISSKALEAYDYALGDVGELVTEVPSKVATEDIAGFTAAENLERVELGMPYEEAVLGEKRVQIANAKFGRLISLYKESILFDQTGEMLQRASRIGDKMGIHRHRYIIEKTCSLACDATGEDADKSLVYGGTAYALFSDDHSSIDNQTNDNSASETLSTAGITAVLALGRRLKDEQGDALVWIPRFILAPPELDEPAWNLYNNPERYDSSNRAMNPYKGRHKPIVSPFLTDTNQWYIGDPAKQMRWQWVWKPTVEQQTSTSEAAFERDIVQRYKISYMGGCGATDYRYLVMSQPS